MPYTKEVIENLLENFIKTSEEGTCAGDIKLISYQNIDEEILLVPAPTGEKWKLCYLFYHAENIFHALIVTPTIRTCILISENNDEVNSNLTRLIPLVYKTYGRSIRISLSRLPLDSASAATGFVEAIRQYLLQGKIEALDIHAALVKDVEYCLNQFHQKAKIINSIRLIDAYGILINAIADHRLKQKEQYQKVKKIQYQKTFILKDHLRLMSSAELRVLIENSSSEAELLFFLEKVRKKYLALLLKTEQGKFLKPTAKQRLQDLFLILYYTSAIGTGDTLSMFLTIATEMVSTGEFQPNVNKNTRAARLLRAGGIITGAYFLYSGGIYSAIRPPIVYFGSQLAQYYLNVESFNDETGEVIAPYLSYTLDSQDWYLLIANLFLLADACWSDEPRGFVYAGAAIATNLLFIQLAKHLLPLFKDDPNVPNETQTYIRMALLIFVSFCSRIFSNTVVDYAYTEFDNQVLCTEAQAQLQEGMRGQTALESQCRFGRTPFWRTPPKLDIHATNTKGQTFKIECDTQHGPNKLANCAVTAEYANKLLRP